MTTDDIHIERLAVRLACSGLLNARASGIASSAMDARSMRRQVGDLLHIEYDRGNRGMIPSWH